jgi:isoamylase
MRQLAQHAPSSDPSVDHEQRAVVAAVDGRRWLQSFDRFSAVLSAIQQDPMLCHLKLIAEPWDLSEVVTNSATSRRLGANWPRTATPHANTGGNDETLAELAARFTRSTDLYKANVALTPV